jgi:biotin-(acetyl-CoA carboxylase) ligase
MDDTRRLILPPPYDQHATPGDVLAQAVARAATDGAGTLVWRHVPGRLDFAVVLEPDDALHLSRRAFVAGMVALAEALAAHCPPEHAVKLRWPDEVRFDLGRLGGARLVVAPGTEEQDIPAWLVFAVDLIADRDHLAAPGAFPHSVSLKEAGFTDPPAIVESFAAHLMLQFDRWKHDGFDSVAARYRARLDGDADLSLLAQALNPARWRDEGGPIL